MKVKFGAVLGTAVLFYFGTGLTPIPLLTWFAPIPILVLAPRTTWRNAFFLAFLAFTLGTANLWRYLIDVAPSVAAVFAIALMSTAFGGAVLLFRALCLRNHPIFASLAFACGWVTFEFVEARFSPHSTFGSLAYSQSDFLSLIQVASWTGLSGITFLLCWIPACLAAAWELRRAGRLWIALPIVAVLVLAVVCLCGYTRMASAPKTKSLPVGLVAADATLDANEAKQRDVALPVIEAYQRRIASLADRGARVVVLPEKFVGITQDYAEMANGLFATTAKDHHVTIIAGFTAFGATARNEAAVFESPSNLRLRYYKRHLVPGWESDFGPGDAPLLMDFDGTRAGVAICKDMDFPQWLRGYGKSGARILFVPAWDFRRDEKLHARMAVLRGVENGFALVRTAQEGLLTAADAYGRIIAEEASSVDKETLVLASVPLGPGTTPYARYGDAFAVLCLLGTVCFVMLIASTHIATSAQGGVHVKRGSV